LASRTRTQVQREPSVDDGANFADYVTNPTLRNDLVAAFLTGVEGINKPPGVVPAEMMRLNTSIAPKPQGQQHRLGVVGGDTAGFPNGRRPGDDVVDIELRVAMGPLCTLNLGCAHYGRAADSSMARPSF
jgi:hypothetical protein